MTSDEAILFVIDTLERLAIPYMVVGSLSVNLYAFPRSTKDADFVLQMPLPTAPQLISALCEKLDMERPLSFETITGTQKLVFDCRETAFKFELFQLSDDPHDQARFARRRQLKIQDRITWAASLEDVIITKLRWSRLGSRRKDIDDVRNILAVQREHVDWPYVRGWCEKHGTAQLVDAVIAELQADLGDAPT